VSQLQLNQGDFAPKQEEMCKLHKQLIDGCLREKRVAQRYEHCVDIAA